MNIAIDRDILQNSYRTLGCIVATLVEMKESKDKINRYADYIGRALVGNSRFTYNNFVLMKRKLQADFGLNIIKEDGTGFTLKDFRDSGGLDK
jgi:hypothetical protein